MVWAICFLMVQQGYILMILQKCVWIVRGSNILVYFRKVDYVTNEMEEEKVLLTLNVSEGSSDR